tara:strand:+ start:88 stop:2592 length:2505 start_codon:yes stop_codon:yes gene_type:complete
MSKVLKRKLFRHKYQIATNQVPGALLGGIPFIGPALGAVGRYTVKPVFNALSAAARTRLGGAGILGLETAAAGKGAYDVGTGLIEGDRDKTLSGLTEIGLSAPFIPGTFRGAKEAFEKKGVPFFKETGKKVGKGIESLAQKAGKIPGADVVARNPIKSAIVGAGVPYLTSANIAQNEALAASANEQLQNVFGERTPPASQSDAIARENLEEEINAIESDALTKTGLPDANDKQTENIYTERINQANKEDNFSNDDNVNAVPPSSNTIELDEKNIVLNQKDANDAAASLITSEDNPEGDKTKSGVISKKPMDPMSIGYALSKTEKDFKRSTEALKEYEDYIQDKKDSKQSFEEYKAKYKAMIGDDNSSKMYRDLALLKWASRMMTGKTAQAGINGFFDVLGQATEPLADDILAIDLRERQQNKALVDQYLAYETALNSDVDTLMTDKIKTNISMMQDFENSKYQGTEDYKNRLMEYINNRNQYELDILKLEREYSAKRSAVQPKNIKTYLENNPNGFFENSKQKVVIGFTETGRPMQQVSFMNKDNKIDHTYEPYQGNFSDLIEFDEKGNQSNKSKTRAQLESIKAGLGFVDRVKAIANTEGGKAFLGTRGSINNFKKQVMMLFSEVGDYTGTGSYAEKFNNILSTDKNMDDLREFVRLYGDDDVQASVEKDIADALKQQNIADAVKKRGLDPSDAAVLQTFAELKIIETRMKYILANANKGADRLTVKDVEDAKSATQIISLFTPGNSVVAQYETLESQLNSRFITLLQNFETQGGDVESLVTGFKNLPVVDMLEKRRKKKIQKRLMPQTQQKEEVKTNEQAIEELDLGGAIVP